MSLNGVLLAGRRAAEARMLSTCTIRRQAGVAPDPTTGLGVTTWTVVYTGPVRIGGSTRGSSGYRADKVAALESFASTRVANLPWDTSGLADGDLIEITGGESVGLVFRIIEADWQDQATAQRMPVDAVPRPSEWG